MSASLPSSPVRSKTTFLDGGESGHQLGVNGHGGGPASGRTGVRRNNSDNVVLERRADHLGHRPKVEKEVLVGTPVKEGHVNYMLMYDMLTGIRISVSRCTAKPERELMGLDFKAAHKLAFDVTGNELTPSSKYDFKFKDYAPWVFRLIRQVYHVDPADYLLSLTGKYVLSELGSPGKSGSFFYYSQDYRFIIKTIHHSEHKFMMHILQRYYEHIKNNRETLLCRIFGLHRVKLPGNRKIHFVVMGNVFPSGKDIHESYDLKGSLVGRYIDAAEEEKNPRVTLKDMNWVGRQRKLQLGPQKRAAFVDQLEKDVSFLVSQKIMDYSLLIGCHDMSRGNRDNIRDNTLAVFEPDPKSLTRGPSTRAKAKTSAKTKAGPAGKRGSKAQAMKMILAESEAVALGPSNSILPEASPPERQNCLFYSDHGGFQATDPLDRPLNEIYYIGIIDIFTKYNYIKKGEHVLKSLSGKRKLISSVHPILYGARFLAFMKAAVRGWHLKSLLVAEPDPDAPPLVVVNMGDEEEDDEFDVDDDASEEDDEDDGDEDGVGVGDGDGDGDARADEHERADADAVARQSPVSLAGIDAILDGGPAHSSTSGLA